MNYRCSLVFLCVVLPSWCGDYVKTQPETTSTQHFDFAPGGTIRLDASYGDLFIDGWDQPEVEMTVTKSMRYGYGSLESPQVAKRMASVELLADRRSSTELVITNKVPPRSGTGVILPPMPSDQKAGVLLEYDLHVPRNARLVIHHGTGQILIRDISGEIDATCSMGEMSLWLPGGGAYAIDARSRVGTVLSEFGGTKRSHYLFGQTFMSEGSTGGQRIHLRVGYGNITIEPILPEAEEPHAGR